ncbi:MAG: response regulator [Myxococcales bacterium]|nr:response regulator [Myxococcales bacterium]
MDRLYTTHDISRLLQVDPSTVSKWIDRGIMLAFRTPGGHRRVRQSDLRTFLVAHQMPVPDELGSGVVRLVVVDDEKPALEAIKRAFRPFANEVELVTTTSAIEAILLVSELRPHGLLIDLTMPELDGLEVVRRVKARKQLEGVRVLTMAGRHSPEQVDASIKAGAIACLPKPVEAQRVIDFFKVPVALAAARK